MIMRAASRPTDDYDAEPHRWSVEGDDYDQLYAEVQAAVPEGWRLLHLRVER